MSWTEHQFGVIVDRTSKGLGFYLAHTGNSLNTAKIHAELVPEEFPVEIKCRVVTYSDWESLS